MDNKINGLTINGIGAMGQKLNGVSITFGLNNYYKFNGVLIAGLENMSTKGNGVQIGLFNYCKDCKVVQIGLWNKIGKRGLPIINFRF